MDKMIKKLIVITLITAIVICVQDVMNYGAIPNEDTFHAQLMNQKAINDAILKANSSESTGDARIIIIPNRKFYSLPIRIHDCYNIILQIHGKLSACNRIKNWPRIKQSSHYSYQDFISIERSANITLNGGGKIDGRGYIWWLDSWIVSKKYLPAGSNRPHLINTDLVKNLTIHDLLLKNSPQFHIKLSQTIDTKIFNLDIKVNTTAQLDIIKRNYLIGTIPLFPLNTDGIDPSGRNFHIYNITCQNYDDVVVPKPAHRGSPYANCTENLLIQNITVRLGVGLSIGSVPPNDQTNCIRNITFRNAVMEKPLKGIYVKTNPGNHGDGIIDNILYENITMHQPVWWAVYLGPQQQKQPDKGGPGCMFYPYDPKKTCQTQPRINITNIKLKDVRIRNSLLFPFVLRCNQTNPCKNITFENVDAKGWLIGKKAKGYVCQNVLGSRMNTYPKIDCLKDITSQALSENQQISHNLNEEEQNFDVKFILQRMEKASQEIPYEDEDDEMQSGLKWLKMDLQYLKSLGHLFDMLEQ